MEKGNSIILLHRRKPHCALSITYFQEALNVLVWIFVGSSSKLACVLHQLDYANPQLKAVGLMMHDIAVGWTA